MVLGRAFSEPSDIIRTNKSWKYYLEETSKGLEIPGGTGLQKAVDQVSLGCALHTWKDECSRASPD